MSERRYVVELTRPVTGSDLSAAADEIARRLGLDVVRVETLLKGRIGPVTKPVLAEKADSIAQVFQEAGVSVAIYEARPEVESEDTAPAETPVQAAPAASTQQTVPGLQGRGPEASEPEDTGAKRSELEDKPEAAGGRPDPTKSDYQYEAPAPVLPPDLDRWDAYDPWPGMDPWRETALEPEPVAPDEPARAPERDTQDGPDADEWPLPAIHEASVVRPAVWQAGSDADDRRPLRVYLLIALGIAVLLLIALQLLYRGWGTTGLTYDDGLAAYREGDFVAARRAWTTAASGGSVRAEFMLGHLAQHGLGRPWSFREAAQRYHVAADAGLPEAQLALSELYFEGLGVEPDPTTGMAWLSRAAVSGHPLALLRQGEALLHGVAGRQDFDAALSAFTAAADAGSSEAADYVGFAHHFGAASGMMVP